MNYHLHVLVTEGGLNEVGEWQKQEYVSYKGLRQVWQYQVLSRLREVMKEEGGDGGLIDRMFRKYGNGFYVHAEPRVKNGSGISRYIGRYLRHPAIADRVQQAICGISLLPPPSFGGKRRAGTTPMTRYRHNA